MLRAFFDSIVDIRPVETNEFSNLMKLKDQIDVEVVRIKEDQLSLMAAKRKCEILIDVKYF